MHAPFTPVTRRAFVKTAAVAGIVAATSPSASVQAGPSDESRPPGCRPCLFSKPLGNRKVAELPAILNELGITAVDLTCRPEGHVVPDRVTEDLPRAVELLGKAGVAVPMITTAILDATEPHAEAIIKTASQLGIRRLKVGYYQYKDLRRILPTLAEAKARLRDVAVLCHQYRIQAGYHLHSGLNVGAAQWDAYQLLDGLPPMDAGCYYDARHMTVEGGLGGWQIGLNLLLQRVTIAAVKDFAWVKGNKGKWEVADVPLGEGMVRHDQAFRILKQGGFAGPVSLHCEYCKPSVPVESPAEKANWDHIGRDWRTMLDLLKHAELL